jgi:hypothetical protein
VKNLFPSTPQRSEISSTTGRPHPSCRILDKAPKAPQSRSPDRIPSRAPNLLRPSPSARSGRRAKALRGGYYWLQLAHHLPDVLELFRRQEIRQPVQSMARGRNDLGFGGESHIDLSYHLKSRNVSASIVSVRYPQSRLATRRVGLRNYCIGKQKAV